MCWHENQNKPVFLFLPTACFFLKFPSFCASSALLLKRHMSVVKKKKMLWQGCYFILSDKQQNVPRVRLPCSLKLVWQIKSHKCKIWQYHKKGERFGLSSAEPWKLCVNLKKSTVLVEDVLSRKMHEKISINARHIDFSPLQL